MRDDLRVALVEAIHYVGVSVALVGAFVTAPSGTKALVGDIRRISRSSWRFFLNHLPWHRRPSTARMLAATGTIHFAGTATLTVDGWGWRPEAPLAEQLEDLRQRTETLSERIRQQDAGRRQATEALRREFAATTAELEIAISAAHRAIEERDRDTALVDATGLPLIGVGILLSGLPDQAVGHWWVSAPLLLLAALVTIRALATRRRPGG